jgi:Thioredoxin like C-terminal domain/AhpC/TSA family
MRTPPTAISAPEFPSDIEWVNVPFLPMSTLLGRSVALVWFWDYCSLNALRALPYLQEWHRRYGEHGLRVIGIHSPQFEFGAEREKVAEAVRRLDVEFAVAPDPEFAIWRQYGNEVWPSLYMWDRRGVLRHYHFGEGGYEETELAIQLLLNEIDDALELPEPMAPLRRTDHPGALVHVPSPHRYMEEDRTARPIEPGEALSVSYEGATAAAVLDGEGKLELEVDGKLRRIIRLDGPRLYKLVESGRHERHELRLRFHDPARAYAFNFAPGVA